MVAESAFVRVPLIRSARSLIVMSFVVGQQKRRGEYLRSAFFQTRLPWQADEHLIELRPLAVKFMASGKVQRFLVGKEIRQSVFGLGGVRHDGDTLVGRRIVEVAHYDDMRAASYAIKRVAQSTHTQRGIDSVGLCLLLTGRARREMAYQHIERIARNHPSPCMQDIPRTFSFACKTDPYRTLTEQLKPFVPIEQSVVDTARVIPPG